MVTNAVFSIGTTATLIATGAGRTKVVVTPGDGSGSVSIGSDNTVTGDMTGTGFILPSGATYFEIGDGDELWAVNWTSSKYLHVLTMN